MLKTSPAAKPAPLPKPVPPAQNALLRLLLRQGLEANGVPAPVADAATQTSRLVPPPRQERPVLERPALRHPALRHPASSRRVPRRCGRSAATVRPIRRNSSRA